MQTLQMIATAQDDVILELQTMIKSFLQSKPNAVIKKMQTQAENESLSGMFSHYVTHRISDKEIAEGIAEGAYQRAMKGLNDE